MKKVFLYLAVTFFASTVSAAELTDFKQLKHAIRSGHNVNIVVHIGQCQPSVPGVPLEPIQPSTKLGSDPISVTGAVRPHAFMIVKNQVFASDLHFNRHNPEYPNQSVFELITYRFAQDNIMTLRSEVLLPVSYAPIGKIREMHCAVGSAVRLFSDSNINASTE